MKVLVACEFSVMRTPQVFKLPNWRADKRI